MFILLVLAGVQVININLFHLKQKQPNNAYKNQFSLGEVTTV